MEQTKNELLPLQVIEGKDDKGFTTGIGLTNDLPLKALNGTVVVRLTVEEKTASGIFIPEEVQKKLEKSGIGSEVKFYQVYDICPKAKEHYEDTLNVGDMICLKNGEHPIGFTIDKVLVGYVETYQILGVKSKEEIQVVRPTTEVN